ncbi:MAG: hypothetical protein NTX03_13855 [Bacteroidetes bacterium]|nr:hypothetical protein [Bacteroidota bacterium]
MKRKLIFATIILGLFVGLLACSKEIQKIFEVQTQPVSLTNINKTALKKQIEYISTAYSDVFGKAMPADELSITLNCYAGLEDKDLVTDRIIRSYLNRGNLVLPASTQLRKDIPAFINATYDKFYHRPPTEMENYKMTEMIKADTKITAANVYYSFLTSDEYKYH